MHLTADRVRELLDYDPDTGVFRWKVDRFCVRRGQIAGCLDKTHGYTRLMVDGKSHLAHRLAWYYTTGDWPSEEIDHIDLNKSNNSFLNLRAASHSSNGRNCKARSHNRSGFKGVSTSSDRKSYRAQISINGRTEKLGSFPSAEEAHEAYCVAAKRLFGEFARVA